jgi:hypothetical protein
MDKTQPYDEPLDPHSQRLNVLGGTVDEIAGDKSEPKYYVYLNQAKDNVVPFIVRIERAREMAANIDRAISDGHLKEFPDLDAVGITFRTFAERAEILGYEPDDNEPKEGVPKRREELLEIFHLAWVALRRCEGKGFPLMDYAETRAP